MTDNKLTDNEIIKALEYCIEQGITSECPKCKIKADCRRELIANALDLINRLQAEVKKANRTVAGLMYENDELKRLVRPMESEKRSIAEFSFKKGKAEAYKEFAEKLSEGRVSNDNTVILAKCLLKELVGEDNG